MARPPYMRACLQYCYLVMQIRGWMIVEVFTIHAKRQSIQHGIELDLSIPLNAGLDFCD